MAYSSITKPTDYFNTVLYTGNVSGQSITGVGFQPDFLWIKSRSAAYQHSVRNIIRGSTKTLRANDTNAEATQADSVTSFDSDGFTLGADSSSFVNENSATYAAWNWLAAGTAPSKTYTVKVVSDSGNKYRFDDFGTSAVTLEISEGGTYTFDQSDSSNSGHPLRFSTTSDGTHGGGSEYTTGVTTTGTPGSSGAKTVITVAASAPTLYYYCSSHSGMGGQANTPTTNSFSNFDGAVQSNVSPNTTSGVSIIEVSNLNSNSFGHGLGAEPEFIMNKRTDDVANWRVYFKGITSGKSLFLNTTAAETTEGSAIASATSSTITVTGSGNGGSAGAGTSVYFAFKSIKGFSKFGTYTGNGNSNGAFVYTGFKPAWVLIKKSSSTGNWNIFDTKRDGYNGENENIFANASDAESSGNNRIDIVSNGFKLRASTADVGSSGGTYIYLAFAENPFVGNDSGTGIPATAK